MIDWQLTKQKFGYDKLPDVVGIKRPIVVCRCDICNKDRDVAIRVKSRVVNDQMDWKCPSCVSLGRSKDISLSMKKIWSDEDYRPNQTQIKSQTDYKQTMSNNIKVLWKDPNYRSQLEVGIRADQYVDKAKSLFPNKFEYYKDSFCDWTTRIKIKCLDCNMDFHSKPQNHLNNGYCPYCKVSSGQRLIFDAFIDYDPVLNDRTALDGLEIDVFLPKHKVGIEYHGRYWHSFDHLESKEQKFRHQTKALAAISKGIKLYQIFDYEWENQKQLLKSMISHSINKSYRIYARKCEVTIESNNSLQQFLNNNHLQGFRNASINLGLRHLGKLVGCMTFSRYQDGYEIIRLAFQNRICVIGGASKLFKHFLKSYKPKVVYTFADLRISSGLVYTQLGFTQISYTEPGYKYFRGDTILSRQRCQKHRLQGLLENFDSNLSEPLNMFNNGYRRLWDAGNIKLKYVT